MATIKLQDGKVVLKDGKASCACCCNWSQWEPDASQVCFGTIFQQTRYDINGVCPSESQQATGTSSPNWSPWEPAEQQVCSGENFQQTRYDINGVCPSETRPATGTGAGAPSITLTNFEATGGTVYVPQGICIVQERTITGPGDGFNTPLKILGVCQPDCPTTCVGYSLDGAFRLLGASLISINPMKVNIRDYFKIIDMDVTIGNAPTQAGTYTYPVQFTEDRLNISGAYTGNVTIQVTCG